MAAGLILKPVTLLQFNSRLSAIVQSLLEDFIPQQHQGDACRVSHLQASRLVEFANRQAASAHVYRMTRCDIAAPTQVVQAIPILSDVALSPRQRPTTQHRSESMQS